MHSIGTPAGFQRAQRPAGPHLLDAAAFWAPGNGLQRRLSSKAMLLTQHAWRHTLLAPRHDGWRVLVDRGHAQRLIEQAQPDLVECADASPLARAALCATARLGVPAVAFCHSDLPVVAARLLGGENGLATVRGRWAARHARRHLADLYAEFDLVLAATPNMARHIASWGVRQVLVQPPGVDCKTFKPAARDPEWRMRLCRRLGLHPSVRLIVTTGDWIPANRLQLLADAVAVLGTGHALLAVGAGPRPPQGPGVHLLAAEHNSASLSGSLARTLARTLASCDVYVDAGDQAVHGTGALQAMACGTPLVISAGGAIGDLAHGVSITVARRGPQAAQEWAEAISACLLADPTALRSAALERAREHDWPLVLDQLSRRYMGLLRRHTGTAPRFAPPPAAAAKGATGSLQAAARMGSSAPAQPRLAPRFGQ